LYNASWQFVRSYFINLNTFTMKKQPVFFALPLLVQFVCLAGFSQVPDLVWSEAYGGSESDVPQEIQQSGDGGYIIAATTQSDDADVPENHGQTDGWIIKLDSAGQLIWSKVYGGSAKDDLRSVVQTHDGGYIAAGSSASSDFDIHGNHGGVDAWVIRLDASGDTIWSRLFGGTDGDYAFRIRPAGDGGYLVAGSSNSVDHDVPGNNGMEDAWVFKIDDSGNLLWSYNYGGSENDAVWDFRPTCDGGYAITAVSSSHDGDVPEDGGGGLVPDCWVFKLDSLGMIEWSTAYGDWTVWEEPYAIQQTMDKGYIVTGWTETGGTSWTDALVIKLDSLGNVSWSKTYGGSGHENANTVHQTADSGFMFAGSTSSPELIKMGKSDAWLVRTDKNGDSTWSNVYGGSEHESFKSLCLHDENKWALLGISKSNDGDVPLNHGDYDLWVMAWDTVSILQEGLLHSKLIGGSGYDFGRDIQKAADGSFYLVGSTGSVDGDFPRDPGPTGIFAAKLSSELSLYWTRSSHYGTHLTSSGYAVDTVNGGCVVGGTEYSSGPQPDHNGVYVTFDEMGNQLVDETINPEGHLGTSLWLNDIVNNSNGKFVFAGQKNLGGIYGVANGWYESIGSEFYSINTMHGNGYVASGRINTVGGDLYNDGYIVRIDINGDTLWTTTLGGSSDDRLYGVIAIPGGQFVAAGSTMSNTGDIDNNKGISDVWVVKLDDDGSLLWSKTFGGSGYDEAKDVMVTDDGLIVIVGWSTSSDFDVPDNQGQSDYLLMVIDQSGTLLFAKTAGGSGSESAYAVETDEDGNYLAFGDTNSEDGDVEGNHGNRDAWLLTFEAYKPSFAGAFVSNGQSLGTMYHTAIALGDIDNDDDLDAVVTTDQSGSPHKVWLNDGSANFTDGNMDFGNGMGHGITLHDFNNDGYLDVFVARDGANKVYLGDGSGFTSNGQNLGNLPGMDVDKADLDGDGDMDVAVANNSSGNPNKAWLNNGSAIFFDPGLSLGTENSSGLALGDLDGDGDADGFVANDGPNKIYLNMGAGTASTFQRLGNNSSESVKLADMDGDGDLDAVVANNASGTHNKVYLNNGQSIFFDPGLNLGSDVSWDLALGDLDHDGDIDGFVANDGPNKVYTNDWANTTDNGQLLGNNNSYGIALGDLDGDGDLDAFVANYDGPCKVWMNQTMENMPEALRPAATAEKQELNRIDNISIKPAVANASQSVICELKVYPNPIRSSAQIRFKTNAQTHARVEVYNTFGLLIEVLYDGLAMAGEEYLLQFNGEQYPKGMYILHLVSGDQRLLKEKVIIMM
jgi:hypothetical protein